MTTTEQFQYAWTAWSHAVTKGYVTNAIYRHVGAECFDLLVGGVAGIVTAVGAVMVGTGVGAAAGGAIAGYFSAGNPAAAYAGAELGATIGKTIAEAALVAIGLGCLVYHVAEYAWEIGRLAIAAYDISVNQLPLAAGQSYDILLELAARWYAEAVGVFCAALVLAIAIFVCVRLAKSGPGQAKASQLKELFESKLNEWCKGLVQWIVPRAQELRYKIKPGGKIKFQVVTGGVGPDQVSLLSRVSQTTRRIMPQVVDRSTLLVRFRRFQDLHDFLVSEGFRLTTVSEWGPAGGKQLFYERGNICCRIKTMGDKAGPRAGKPHISFGINDGMGTRWWNDLAKVDADGKLTFKALTTPQRFSPTETITDPANPTPQRFIGIQGGLDPRDPAAVGDAWANNCHFNMPDGFDWAGLEQALQAVRP